MKTVKLFFGIVVFATIGTIYAVHRQRENERFAMRRRILLELAEQRELKRLESLQAVKKV